MCTQGCCYTHWAAQRFRPQRRGHTTLVRIDFEPMLASATSATWCRPQSLRTKISIAQRPKALYFLRSKAATLHISSLYHNYVVFSRDPTTPFYAASTSEVQSSLFHAEKLWRYLQLCRGQRNAPPPCSPAECQWVPRRNRIRRKNTRDLQYYTQLHWNRENSSLCCVTLRNHCQSTDKEVLKRKCSTGRKIRRAGSVQSLERVQDVRETHIMHARQTAWCKNQRILQLCSAKQIPPIVKVLRVITVR